MVHPLQSSHLSKQVSTSGEHFQWERNFNIVIPSFFFLLLVSMHTCHLWLTGTFFHTCNTEMSLFFCLLQIEFLITSCYSRHYTTLWKLVQLTFELLLNFTTNPQKSCCQLINYNKLQWIMCILTAMRWTGHELSAILSQLDKMEGKLDIILLLRGSSFQLFQLTPTSRSETSKPCYS